MRCRLLHGLREGKDRENGESYPVKSFIVRFYVIMAANMKSVFWDVALCRFVKLTEVPEVLAASIIRTIALMKAVSIFETSVSFFETTQRNIP
jgi:hypothetical protein